MSLKALVCCFAVLIWTFFGCASASYFEGEGGRKVIQTAALGQSLAYACDGLTVEGPPEEMLAELAMSADAQKVDMEEIIRQIGFTQLPTGNGLCVVAKGGPINSEVKEIMHAWLWSVGIRAVGDAVGNLFDVGKELGKDAINN